jgi:hypothetical protein
MKSQKEKYQQVIGWRRRAKARMVEAFGSECCICKIKSYPEIYDFHHINPDEKEFGIGALCVRAWDKLVIELRKCVMMCSNCHRLYHRGYLEIPKDAKRFDESFAEYIVFTKNGQMLKRKFNGGLWNEEKKPTPCLYCGKEKSNNLKYCSPTCAGKAKRKVDRPTKEKLQELIKIHPFTHIGKMYNVRDNTIRKWCSSYDITCFKK